MAPNSPVCSLIQASMAGARSTAPLNRSNSVLIVATLESAGVFSHGVLRGTCWFQVPHFPHTPWDRRNLRFGRRVGEERPRPSIGDAR